MQADEKASDVVPLLSAPALGDGLLTLVLAHNLHRQERRCVLYHTQLQALAAWLPWLRIEALPDAAGRAALLRGGSLAFVGDPSLVPADAGASDGHLVFCKDRWDRARAYLRSLQHHAERLLGVHWSTDACDLKPPPEAARVASSRRVVLHPFTARAAKDWPVARWVRLAELLGARGWEPVVLLAPGEETRWRTAAGDACATAVPGPLDAVAIWIRASAGVIAGDSGIGHLASALEVPTLSLFRKASAARFWRPAWGRTAVVCARWRLPGGRGHRHWGRLLPPRRVAAAFHTLMGPPPR